MDRELTRAELDELVPLFALDALDGEEREQVARYIERDRAARSEMSSLREAVALLPPANEQAPASLWSTIETALEAPAPDAPRPELLTPIARARTQHRRDRRPSRMAAAALAVAAAAAIVVLGVETVHQQDRIDELAAEMHRNPMREQAMAARARTDAHVIELAAASGTGRAEIVMLPDGTGYFMDHNLPALPSGSTYQLWAQVGDADSSRMVSLGVLGADPGIAAFHVSAPTTKFVVTKEAAPGNVTPNDTAVMSGTVA